MTAQTAPAGADQLPPTAQLAAVVHKLNESDYRFALSLLSQAAGRGLSPKQQPWIQKLIDRATGPAEQPRHEIGGSVAEIVQLLERPGSKLKHPRILVRVGERDLRLSIAGQSSKYPGTVNVADTEQAFADRTWFGRVHRDGRYEPSRGIDAETSTAILAALRALAIDPAGTAKAYGKLTGNCCFCATKLTDERSTHEGYGPVCAKHYGLPWGK